MCRDEECSNSVEQEYLHGALVRDGFIGAQLCM